MSQPPGGVPAAAGDITGRRQLSVETALGEEVGLKVAVAVGFAVAVCTLLTDPLVHPVTSTAASEQIAAVFAIGIPGDNAGRALWFPRGTLTCARVGHKLGPMEQPVAAATTPGRGLTVAGGVLGIVGALLVIPACARPYTHDSQGALSIFNPGDGGIWFAIEPVTVMLMAIATGIILLVSRQRVLQIGAAAVLLGIGVQTFFMFAGYAGFNLSSGEQSGAPGSVIGLLAGLCLATGGLIAAIRAGWWGHQPDK